MVCMTLPSREADSNFQFPATVSFVKPRYSSFFCREGADVALSVPLKSGTTSSNPVPSAESATNPRHQRSSGAFTHGLVRVLGAIVGPQPLLMTAGPGAEPGMRRHGSEACLDCQLGRKAVLAEQFDAGSSRRGWISRSRISPSWSTASHRYIRLPAIRTTISSRCHRLPGRGRRWRRPRAIAVLSRQCSYYRSVAATSRKPGR